MRIGFVIPTKDRPDELQRLLASLLKQTDQKDKVIVVYCGNHKTFIKLIKKYKTKVIFLLSKQPGQVGQRQIGIKKLKKFKWICFFDDDIVLLPQSLKKVKEYLLNKSTKKLGAISFNLINEKKFKARLVQKFLNYFKIFPLCPGNVAASGCIGSIAALNQNIKSEWVLGGATIWRSSILKSNPNKAPVEDWAFAEDINYSYPIGKKWEFIVLKEAKALHLHPQKKRPINWESIVLHKQFFYAFNFNKKYFPSEPYAFVLHQSLFLLSSILRGLKNNNRTTVETAFKL